jgi:sulfatase modifying factor 1
MTRQPPGTPNPSRSAGVPGEGGPCCAPARPSAEAPPAAPREPVATAPASTDVQEAAAAGMVTLEGEFLMGTEDPRGFPGDGEGPVREVKLAPFMIDSCAVSNRRFAEFAEATGHVTDAERYGWSFVFGGLLPDDFELTRGVAQAPWWRQVFGATWRTPEGPHSSVEDRLDHPVVHVSWRDAQIFTAWAGVRLPTEAEWEYAARGGLVQQPFPWGDQLEPGGEHRMNVWQGVFPSKNSLADGFLGTCPVDEFPANDHGLHNTSGNTWEWCSDWFHTSFHRASGERVDPRGPSSGEAKVIRGGSYLCHHSYCDRYRVAARSSNTLDTSTGNIGFRCARDNGPR